MKRIALILLCLMPAMVWGARKVTWVIDPGHGGHDTGCEGRLALEKDICLNVAKEVGRLVKKNISGVRVVYTREKDVYPSLSERCNMANARGAELFVSIHVNSAANPYVRGTESFYATNVPLSGAQAGKSELLALLLQRQYLSHGREISRGVKQRELYVCENTNMPSVLTEIGFITNTAEEAYLVSKAGQKELAEAIYMALAEYAELTRDGTVDKRKLRNLRYSHYAPISMTSVKAQQPVAVVTPAQQAADDAQEAAEIVKDNKAKAEAAAMSKAEAAAMSKAETEKTAAKAEPAAQPRQAAAGSANGGSVGGSPVKGSSVGGSPVGGSPVKGSPVGGTPVGGTPVGGSPVDGGSVDGGSSAISPSSSSPYFAIQIMNTATKLKAGDYRLKGFKDVRYISAGERFKVIYSHATDYQVIKNELSQVRETFPEAFIVAFVGERQITTAEALELLKR